jgi:hypothetical protein
VLKTGILFYSTPFEKDFVDERFEINPKTLEHPLYENSSHIDACRITGSC